MRKGKGETVKRGVFVRCRSRAAWLLFLVWSSAEAIEVRFTVDSPDLPPAVLDDIRKTMAPVQIKDIARDLGNTRLMADGRLKDALEVFGYYHAHSTLAPQYVNQGTYALHYTVKAGPPVRIDSIHLGVEGPGSRLPVWSTLRAGFPLKPGGILRQDLYEKAKAQWSAAAQDQGYIDADFAKHVIAIDRRRDRADIDLVLATGPQYVFGPASIEGGQEYPPGFLRRYLDFKPGQIFSFQKISNTQLNYQGSDRFDTVAVAPDRGAAHGNVMPVKVLLQSSKPRRFRGGVGYGTDTGARITASYDDLNFRRSGRELHLESNLSQRRTGLAGRFVWPSHKNWRSYTTLQSGFQREVLDTYTSKLLNVTLEQTEGFAHELTVSPFLTYRNEVFQLGLQNGHSKLIMPGLRVQQTLFDTMLRPKKGFRYDVRMQTSYRGWGSDTDFVQLLGYGEGRIPLTSRNRFVLRGQAGSTFQHNGNIYDLPPTIRFFAGGDRSVRGYAYQSEGPRDASGVVIGGTQLLTGSVEFQQDIGSLFGAVLFYDTGNAFSSARDFKVLKSVGVGARVYTPIGPIRLDIAHPLGDPTANRFRIHFSAGVTW